MRLPNNSQGFGLISIAVHWFSALLLALLFLLGLGLAELHYYDANYPLVALLHEQVGLASIFLCLIRILWILGNPSPQHHGPAWQQRWLVRPMHGMLYLLMLAIPISGYLLVSSDGSSFSFGPWQLPALPWQMTGEWAEELHEITAWLLLWLVGFHAAAALKHHYWDQDNSLRRMLRPS